MPPKKKPETKKKKGRKLAKKEIKYIVESLREVDIETMLSSVRSFVDQEEHIHFFSSRQTVWTHVSTFKLRLIVSYLKDEFVLLYESYGQKRGGFATLLRDWHVVCGRLSCESLEDEKSSTVWVSAKEGYSDVISSDDRSAIMSFIGAACYAFFQKQVSYLIQHWSSVQLKYQELLAGSPSPVKADDDIALYRLWGFSLFASIRFRKSALTKFKKRYTVLRKQCFTRQLEVLQSLLETDKSSLPAVIRLQDRGRMSFPHRILIPLMKKCSVAIKSKMNAKLFKTCGYEMIKVCATVRDTTSVHLVG